VNVNEREDGGSQSQKVLSKKQDDFLGK